MSYWTGVQAAATVSFDEVIVNDGALAEDDDFSVLADEDEDSNLAEADDLMALQWRRVPYWQLRDGRDRPIAGIIVYEGKLLLRKGEMRQLLQTPPPARVTDELPEAARAEARFHLREWRAQTLVRRG